MRYATGRSKSRIAFVSVVLACSGCQTYSQPGEEYDSMDIRALEELAEARRDNNYTVPAYSVSDPRALEEQRAYDEASLPICAGPDFLIDYSNQSDAEQQERLRAYDARREREIQNGVCRRN